MKNVRIVVLPFCLLASTTVFAQSKIECTVGSDGTAHAPLIWQNTLGIARANSICQAQIVKRIEPRQVREPGNGPAQRSQVVASRFSNETKDRASSFVEVAQPVEKPVEKLETDFSRAW